MVNFSKFEVCLEYFSILSITHIFYLIAGWLPKMDLNYNKNARCQSRLALHQCLAIVLRKEGCQGDPGDFWMYENGYPLFQVNIKDFERSFLSVL